MRRCGWLVVGGCLWMAPGCLIEVADEDDPQGDATGGSDDPCDDVACSVDGYCSDGECFCNPYFVGNPYALYGCQPSTATSSCDTTCGLNAFCDDGLGACVCAEGFVAVCGTGDCLPEALLCDGNDDCVNGNDELAEVCTSADVQQWAVTDVCDDGQDIAWRLWSLDRGWVWPSLSSTFFTDGYDVITYTSIECVTGETICLGAELGGASWGVGLDGVGDCEDCCWPCQEGVVDFGALACG
ncbi:MAG: hypothetical protein AAGA54_12840 [Myxococcota bacterium]